MKEQGRNSQDQINKEEIDKLLEKEFRVMTIKMSQDLKNRIEEIKKLINTFNKDLEEVENKQTEMNNTLLIKNILEGRS